MTTKVIYEPHPVSAERKAELRAQGYTILDAIYRPKDAPAEPAQAAVPAAPTDVEQEQQPEHGPAADSPSETAREAEPQAELPQAAEQEQRGRGRKSR